MSIYFCGDLHLLHANICIYSGRDEWFKPEDVVGRSFKDRTIALRVAKDMTDGIIQSVNEVVKSNDDVYHLGDFAFGKESVQYGFSKLKGRWHCLYGNHDRDLRMCALSKYNGMDIDIIPAQHEILIDKQLIVLSHYAMRVWNRSHYGSYHLYAHSHETLPDDPNSRSMDVGIDNAKKLLNQYRPFHYDEIKAFMDKKTWKPIDHHEGE
jgi:calcineurin-like phosphoesterase family protein